MSTENERLQFCRAQAALLWTKEHTKHKVLDVDIAEEVAKLLLEESYKPNLGCATTRELLDELEAREPSKRAEINALKQGINPNYRTIDS